MFNMATTKPSGYLVSHNTPLPECWWNMMKLSSESTKIDDMTRTETWKYRQASNIGRAFVGNKIIDHSDVVGASPVGAGQLHLYSGLHTWLR